MCLRFLLASFALVACHEGSSSRPSGPPPGSPGSRVNLGLAAATLVGPFGSRNPLFGPTLDRNTLTVVAGEDEQGEVDLNDNAIPSEDVPFAVNVRSGKARLAD